MKFRLFKYSYIEENAEKFIFQENHNFFAPSNSKLNL